MFGFRKPPPPQLCPANPGIGAEAKVAIANGKLGWTEKVNLVSVAATAFNSQSYSVQNHETWLRHADSGFMFIPQLVEMHPLDDGSVQTVTTMQVNHPMLIPNGVFEYQHSTGSSMADSIGNGFDQWLRTDLVPLLDALLPTPSACTTMELALPAKDGRPTKIRRAVLGPIAHLMQDPPATDEQNGPDEHPFCPCCLLTRSFDAFRELLLGDDFYCLRLFAMRNAEGVSQADCRVNGEDWEAGAEALREYVTTWPAAGFEFRKQFVVLQTIEKDVVPADAADRRRM